MRSGTRVVCALSGGSDSAALACILGELHEAGELQFVGIAHLNHQLRASADRDERFCRELADRLARPVRVERADIRARAAAQRRSLEVAAHDERYEMFARARTHFAADVVALGHTRDDQAETFLLRLLRGAGPRGLAGIHPRHGDVVRPLLDCRRDELRDYLAERDVPFVEDETNVDRAIPRNRIRTELIPRLAADFNPAIVDVLATEADVAREIWEWLEGELARFGADLEVERLRTAPRALRRLAVWRAMSAASGRRSIPARHVDAALALLDAAEGAAVDAPGQRVHRIGSRLVLRSRDAGDRGNPETSSTPNLYWHPLSIPGQVALAGGATVSAELVTVSSAAYDASADVGNGRTAAVRADLIREPLAVRNRRPGDRFRPVGLKGRKKLQDLFVDRKIARSERDLVPIVVDASDRIVWVAGYGIDEAFRVTDASQGVLLLKLRYFNPTAQSPRGGDPVEACS